MTKISILIYNDLKQIFRDKTLVVLLLTPIILILFVRYFVPFITVKYPLIEDYHAIIMMFGGIQTAIMFGFITAFIMLDEKDENVLQVIRVLPISSAYFIVYRLAFATFFSFLGALFMINMAGIAYPGFMNSILLAIQYGLTAPLITLVIATYARNKVEGMAYFKGLDLVLLLPILSFFLTGAMKYIFVFIPAFWTYTLYETCLGSGNIALQFVIGIMVYGIALFWLFRQFQKRVFDR